MREADPDAVELLAAAAEVHRLQSRHPNLQLRLDALTKQQIASHPDLFQADPDGALVDLVPILVVDDCGRVIPLTHDLDRSLWFGSLLDARLLELEPAWRHTSARHVADLLARAHAWSIQDASPAAGYWFDTVAAMSRACVPR